MSHAGKDHRDAMLVGRRDDLFVFDRAAGLNHGFGAGVGCFVEAVAERVERIGCDRRAFEIQSMGGGAHDGDLGGIDAAHLAGTDAEHLIRRSEYDGVRFHMPADPPGEVQCPIFFRRRFALSHDLASMDVYLSRVPVLNQHAAAHAPEIVAAELGLAHVQFQQPDVKQPLGRRKHSFRFRCETRSDDDLQEDIS